jgi:arylsulfotransferase ASST
MMAEIEQCRLRRAGTGLRVYDPDQAYPGFTLFAPLSHGMRPGASSAPEVHAEPAAAARHPVYLIDMQGEITHTWQMPYPPGEYGYLTERGTLFYNGQILNPSYPGQMPFQAGVALEVDWRGRTLWEIRHPDHHHDGIRLRNGNVLLLCHRALPAALVPKILGGHPGTEHEGALYGDYLIELTTSSQVVWEWRSWEHLDPEEDRITALQDHRAFWSSGNGIAEWPNGDISISFRNISTVVTVSRRTGKIVWKLGAPPLSGQHAPTPLPNGNLLIFDNGPHRLDDTYPYSRVIEVDPASREIVWRYQENPVFNFFSPRISNAQRLPNGNTLICEGLFGRLFEVTVDGEVVWEYVSPYFTGSPKGQHNSVFRAYRYSAADIERARATSEPDGPAWALSN